MNEGFGASAAAGVSLFSAVLPNKDEGCAADALGLSKTKPPNEDGAAAAAPPSLAAAPNRGAGASFFSSGFPKVNVGAAASDDPKVAPPGGVEVVRLGSPNLLNTDVVEVEVVELPSLFSWDEAGGVKLTVEGGATAAAAANDGLSSDLDSPKVKALLGAVFSALEDTAPNATPPPAPNLKPVVAGAAVAGGCSDFFSSLAAVPNLKPPDEPPNLNPEDGAVSLEVASDERPSSRSVEEAPALRVPPPKPAATSDVPKLNPADAEPEELFCKPNLNPPDPESEPEAAAASDAPNLNPPDPNSELELVSDVPNLKPPDPEPKVVPAPDVPNLKPPEVALLEPNAEEPEVPPAARRQHRQKDRTCHFSLTDRAAKLLFKLWLVSKCRKKKYI